MARTLIPGWVDWWLCSVRGGRISDRLRAGVPLPPPPPAFFFLCSLCFVGFAAYWSGPCGLYRDHLLHFVGFIKATPGPFASHLPGAWPGGCRRAIWSVWRAGSYTPLCAITVQKSSTHGILRKPPSLGRLALTCGEGQASRPQNSTVETNPCHCG